MKKRLLSAALCLCMMLTRLPTAALATMLYRYVGEPAVSGSDLSAYSDAAFISDYAQQAMAWAVSEGIISDNTPTTLNPNGKATRAEVATMPMRFCENIAE